MWNCCCCWHIIICKIFVQPYPNDEDVSLVSKESDAYTHAHTQVERLKEEEKEQNLGNHGNQEYQGRRKETNQSCKYQQHVNTSSTSISFYFPNLLNRAQIYNEIYQGSYRNSIFEFRGF